MIDNNKLALKIVDDIDNNPLKFPELHYTSYREWTLKGMIELGEYGTIMIDFNLESLEPSGGFYFDTDVNFRPDPNVDMSIGVVSNLKNMILKKTQPFEDYMKSLVASINSTPNHTA